MNRKKSLLSTSVGLIVVVILTLYTIKTNTNTVLSSLVSIQNRAGVVSWVESFTGGDFDACDKLVSKTSEKLYSSDVMVLFTDRNYYDTALRKVAESIKDVSVTKLVDNGSTTDYDLKIKFKPYKRISSLTIKDEGYLDAVCKDYISGDASQSDFNKRLGSFYRKIYKDSCFQSDSKTSEVNVTLSEEEVNGKMKVHGTVNFVNSLLKDTHIGYNIGVFEDNIKDDVTKILKERNKIK